MAEIPVAIISSGYTCKPVSRDVLVLCEAKIYSSVGVYRTAVYVQIILSQHFWPFVYSSSGAIKCSTKHVLRDSKLQTVARELDFGLATVSGGSGDT
jgi:hypothetical protein